MELTVTELGLLAFYAKDFLSSLSSQLQGVLHFTQRRHCFAGCAWIESELRG